MIEFTIRELREILSRKDARALTVKLTSRRLANRTKQIYVPYNGITRLTEYSVFRVDDCIAYYKKKCLMPKMRHVAKGMRHTIKQLEEIKGVFVEQNNNDNR